MVDGPFRLDPDVQAEIDLFPASRAQKSEGPLRPAPKRPRGKDGMHDAPEEERRAFSGEILRMTSELEKQASRDKYFAEVTGPVPPYEEADRPLAMSSGEPFAEEETDGQA